MFFFADINNDFEPVIEQIRNASGLLSSDERRKPELAYSHAAFIINLPDIEKGFEPRFAGYRVVELLHSRFRYIYEIRFINEKPLVQMYFDEDYVKNYQNSFDYLNKWDRTNFVQYNFSFLKIPALNLEAFWLDSGYHPRDEYYLLNSISNLKDHTLYSAEQFMTSVRHLASNLRPRRNMGG